MENIKDTTSTEQVENSQENDAIASAKARVKASYEKKIANEYIAKSQYEELQAKYNELSNQVKTPAIKEQFLKAGGNEKAFNDWAKINNVLNVDEKELGSILEKSKAEQPYMFGSNKAFNATALPQNQDINVSAPKNQSTYSLDANGFLIVNKK